jgi:hypothetical protein
VRSSCSTPGNVAPGNSQNTTRRGHRIATTVDHHERTSHFFSGQPHHYIDSTCWAAAARPENLLEERFGFLIQGGFAQIVHAYQSLIDNSSLARGHLSCNLKYPDAGEMLAEYSRDTGNVYS